MGNIYGIYKEVSDWEADLRERRERFRARREARLIADLVAALEAMCVFSPRDEPGPDMHAETAACELRDAALARARGNEEDGGT